MQAELCMHYVIQSQLPPGHFGRTDKRELFPVLPLLGQRDVVRNKVKEAYRAFLSIRPIRHKVGGKRVVGHRCSTSHSMGAGFLEIGATVWLTVQP